MWTVQQIELVIDTKNQEYYISNNGEPIESKRGDSRNMFINPFDDYVFRKPSKDKFELFTPDLINSRINRIKNWAGNKYLTIGTLYTSGMITMAKDIYLVKGELENSDYIDIATRFDFGNGEPTKYLSLLKSQVGQYIGEWEKWY